MLSSACSLSHCARSRTGGALAICRMTAATLPLVESTALGVRLVHPLSERALARARASAACRSTRARNASYSRGPVISSGHARSSFAALPKATERNWSDASCGAFL